MILALGEYKFGGESMKIPYRIPIVEDKLLKDPHIVIFGAGASRASCPIDKNGKRIPILKELSKIILTDSEISSYGLLESEIDDFEMKF